MQTQRILLSLFYFETEKICTPMNLKHIYAYCIADSTAFAPPSPLRWMGEAECFVLVREAREDEFLGEAAEERMQDINWLASQASHHEAMIAGVMQTSGVFPLRMGTLFSSEQALRALLHSYGALVRRFLKTVGKQREWSCKVILPAESLAPETVASPTHRSGTSYLLQKQRARQQERQRSEARVSALQHSEECAQSQALDWRARPILRMEEGAMLWNAALLLPPDQGISTIEQALHQIWAPLHAEVKCSGPWAPFSFASELLGSDP
jgi:hypothetical protein